MSLWFQIRIFICPYLQLSFLEVLTDLKARRAGRRFGDANNAVIALGLHRLTDTGEVTAMSEYRKAWFTSTYAMDKTNSSFNGRPPGLTRYYCRWSIPLDLDEDELLRGPEILAALVARLDSDGWNTDGVLKDWTIYRALVMQTPIREEMLEMSLGVDVQISREHIELVRTTSSVSVHYDFPNIKLVNSGLISRLDEIVAKYPPQIQFSPERASKLKGHGLFAIIRIHLEYL